MPVHKLLVNTITASSGTPVSLEQIQHSLAIQIKLSGTGALSAVVTTLGSADGIDYFKIAITSISGTALVTEGFTIKDPWEYIRSDVTTISGTSATVNVTMIA